MLDALESQLIEIIEWIRKARRCTFEILPLRKFPDNPEEYSALVTEIIELCERIGNKFDSDWEDEEGPGIINAVFDDFALTFYPGPSAGTNGCDVVIIRNIIKL